MTRVSQAVKAGILFLILLGGGYVVWKGLGESISGGDGYKVWAKFKDASGLPLKSRVVIAGLDVGQILKLGIDGRYARVTVSVNDEIVLYDNAIIFKKSSSLLGSFYIELDPGTPFTLDANGAKSENKILGSGEQIRRVIEATSPDEIMRKLDQTIPKVDSVLLSVRDLSEDMRSVINGPVTGMTTRLERLVEDEASTVESILDRLDGITRDLKGATTGADERVNRILDSLDDASKGAADLIVSARREVDATGAKVREKLDLVDGLLAPAGSIAAKIDNNEGTLGRLVNDTQLVDDLEDITGEAKGFLNTLFGMQSYVGLRSEYNVFARDFRHYVTIELHTRPDKFYYIELEKGPRGDYPEVALEYDPAVGAYRRSVRIEDKIRFTFQFAKRIDWLTLRYGLKESTGGVGVDGLWKDPWFDNRLKVSVDVFDATFDQLPRVKLSAAYELWGHIYILAGVDELLNGHETLPIVPLAIDEPVQFDEIHIGRDYFFGAMLTFNDLDLVSLLTVGGSALSGVVE